MSQRHLDRLEEMLVDAADRASRRGSGGADPPDLLPNLRALVELDPSRALRWITANFETLESDIAAGAVDDLIHRLVERCSGDANGVAFEEFRPLLEDHPQSVRSESVAMLLQDAEAEREIPIRELLGLLDDVLEGDTDNGALLRAVAEHAAAGGEEEAAHRYLNELGLADPTPGTMRYIRKRRKGLPEIQAPEIRIGLLSSFTIRPLADHLDLECRLLGLRPEIYVAPFDSWTEEIIADDSGLRSSEPEITFLFVSVDDLVPALSGDPGIDFLEEKGEEVFRRLSAVAERYTSWSDGLLVVGSLYSVHRDPDGIARGRNRPSRSDWLNELNARLSQRLGELPRTYLLDLKDTLFRRSGGALDNPKMRHLGRVRFGPGVLGPVARACSRYIAPLKGLTRKCVVVDLDNTLWGGIVGEDGLHGVQIGNTSPGSEYREFQEYLRSLTNRGIILAVNSKNNREDALQVFRERKEMVLEEEDFAAMRINWDPKPDNMASLADELNIGLDSMIFVDDNPHERDMMRQMLPQVLTPDLPRDPSRYRETVAELPQLEKLLVTEEDRMRAEQYRARKERAEFRDSAVSLEDYLHSLNITVEIEMADESTLPRVHQLVQRTNQFNLTTRRYELGELREFAEAPDTRLYTLRSLDRYGDHGLVCVALVRTEGARWTIDSFMASCRVLGHGIEDAMLAAISEDALASGVAVLIGEFIETAKNAPARDFYRKHGFTSDGDEPASGEDISIRWELPLEEGSVDFPEWIQIEREAVDVA